MATFESLPNELLVQITDYLVTIPLLWHVCVRFPEEWQGFYRQAVRSDLDPLILQREAPPNSNLSGLPRVMQACTDFGLREDGGTACS